MTSVLETRRERLLLFAIVAAVAFVGFWVGIRQSPASSEYSSFAEEEVAPGVLAARTNEELSQTPWSSDAPRWAPTQGVAKGAITPRNQAAYQAALATRSEGRAFEGAPPTIPHPVGQGSAQECLVCHDKGAQVGAKTAPPIPHAPYTVCTQCHVPQSPALPMLSPSSFQELTQSNFEGLRQAPYPYLASPGAPPQQPHQSFMREVCSSCHGVLGQAGLQTSHPERQSCQQCHAASSVVDLRE